MWRPVAHRARPGRRRPAGEPANERKREAAVALPARQCAAQAERAQERGERSKRQKADPHHDCNDCDRQQGQEQERIERRDRDGSAIGECQPSDAPAPLAVQRRPDQKIAGGHERDRCHMPIGRHWIEQRLGAELCRKLDGDHGGWEEDANEAAHPLGGDGLSSATGSNVTLAVLICRLLIGLLHYTVNSHSAAVSRGVSLRPPKRRSRRWKSASAARRSSALKSGQSASVKHSSA